MIQYKGYMGKVEFDDEADIFHGELIGLRDVITFQGKTVDEVKGPSGSRSTTIWHSAPNVSRKRKSRSPANLWFTFRRIYTVKFMWLQRSQAPA
jgi:hypothetical protein